MSMTAVLPASVDPVICLIAFWDVTLSVTPTGCGLVADKITEPEHGTIILRVHPSPSAMQLLDVRPAREQS